MSPSIERRDQSVETAWSAMLDWEQRFAYNFLWDLLPIERIYRLKNAGGDLAGAYDVISHYTFDGLVANPMDDSADRVRPFMGKVLYDIFTIHRVVVARAAFALHRVACEQSNEHWASDPLLLNALDGVVELGDQPKFGGVLTRLKSLFCEVYEGVATHNPSSKPKSIGFRSE